MVDDALMQSDWTCQSKQGTYDFSFSPRINIIRFRVPSFGFPKSVTSPIFHHFTRIRYVSKPKPTLGLERSRPSLPSCGALDACNDSAYVRKNLNLLYVVSEKTLSIRGLPFLRCSTLHEYTPPPLRKRGYPGVSFADRTSTRPGCSPLL
jgi:hypothetical protein